MKVSFYILVFILISTVSFSQKDSLQIKSKKTKVKTPLEYNALAPSRAAFYSMIIPGAGQIYNKKYWWQLPLIYGGLGYSIYSYVDQTKNYNRIRTAFKQRKAGIQDEFTNDDGSLIYSDTSLENLQDGYNLNRNYSLLSAILVYALQIIEASVTAHLLQFDTNDNISVSPSIDIDEFNYEQTPNLGLTLKYNF